MQIVESYLPVPWEGKSNFDILVATNEKRNGDLSVFISLLNASTGLNSHLQLHEGDLQATTIFAPTNAALAAFDPSLTVPVGGQYELHATLMQAHTKSLCVGQLCETLLVDDNSLCALMRPSLI